jgi:hypothetical protein
LERALIERLKIVAGDLNYLKDNWDQNAEQETLRITSTTLRRLLVETHGKGTKHLKEAWESMDFEGEPSIKTYVDSYFLSINKEKPWKTEIQNKLINEYHKITDKPFTIGQFYAIIPENRVFLAVNGGVVFRGFGIRSPIFLLGGNPIQSKTKETTITVTDFLKTPFIYICSEIISRKELIEYITHKKGGVHIDTNRILTSSQQRKFTLLDICESTQHGIEVDKSKISLVYFGMLSIGQDLINSPDIENLRRRLNNRL